MTTAPAILPDREAQPSVFGVEFTSGGVEQISAFVTEKAVPQGEGLRVVVTMNLDHVVTLRRNAGFRTAYKNAYLVTADGFPVYLYARWRGATLAGRITGADLFPDIMSRLVPGRHRPFLVASTDETRKLLEARLIKRGFRPQQFSVAVPPYGFETDEAASDALLRQVEAVRPTHIFMGVGSPKSEIWLDRNRARLGDAYGFAFGASLDFFVGTSRRAPRFVREFGLEWLWRFANEPKRLFRRYFIDSWAFFAVVAEDVKRNGQPFAG